MRVFWLGAVGGIGLLVACGASEAPQRAAKAAAGQPGHGGSGGRSGAAGAAVAGTGGHSGTVSAGTGGSDVAPSAGEAGETHHVAAGRGGSGGGGGEPPGSAGEATAGSPSEAGAAGAPAPACDCDAAHDCVDGECVIKPECDCLALGVECSPLNVALGSPSCPIEVQCGSCEAGKLCLETDIGNKVRVCAHCDDAAHTDSRYGLAPECPVENFPAECSVAYSFCGSNVLTTSGNRCPSPNSIPGVGWWCGPPS